MFYGFSGVGALLSFVLAVSMSQMYYIRRDQLENMNGHVHSTHRRVRDLLQPAEVPDIEIDNLLASSRQVIETALATVGQPITITFE
jgi:hypothetical protein